MKKLKMNRKTLQIIAVVTVLAVTGVIYMAARLRSDGETAAQEYIYTVKEQVLADEVTVYLENAAALTDIVSKEAAHEAVESYKAIISSDIDVVNENHTKAIQERIGVVLERYADENSVLSNENIAALSAGVAEIVWQTILSQIETVTEDVEQSEYFYLAESLQEQIKELEERKMKVSIRANIKNNTELTSDGLLSLIEGMSKKELEEFAQSIGLSSEELEKVLENARTETDRDVEEKLTKLEKELNKEIVESGQGKAGKDGQAGERGEAGKSGAAGKSVWVRYAENASGVAMTDRPTADTKYMGTYTGAKASTNPSDYTWSKYVGNDGDSIWIRYAENEKGKGMTKTPNEDTKYMGTYIGAKASAEPEDYTWTRYSDATISYSNGTLYITQ